jgi:hypothetical protein
MTCTFVSNGMHGYPDDKADPDTTQPGPALPNRRPRAGCRAEIPGRPPMEARRETSIRISIRFPITIRPTLSHAIVGASG